MSRISAILMLVVALFATGVARGAVPPSEAELKERFGERHAMLVSLEDRGKVGETTEGLVDVVRDAYRGERITLPDRGAMSIGAFVRAENADRQALYRIIAQRTGEAPEAVAQQAAIRNFRRASPEHFLRLRNGQWVRKKELPPPTS